MTVTLPCAHTNYVVYKPLTSKLGLDGPIECYNCGTNSMVLKQGNCPLREDIVVPDIEWLECEVCGEMLFDPENTDKVINYRRFLRTAHRLPVSDIQ